MAATNADVTIASLAAATVTTNTADMTNPLHRGVKVVVDITAITGTTPSLVVTIQGKDVKSGKYFTILASASLTATGTVTLTVYPGIATSANVSANDVLPATWRVLLTIAGTTPAVTATIGASKLA